MPQHAAATCPSALLQGQTGANETVEGVFPDASLISEHQFSEETTLQAHSSIRDFQRFKEAAMKKDD